MVRRAGVGICGPVHRDDPVPSHPGQPFARPRHIRVVAGVPSQPRRRPSRDLPDRSLTHRVALGTFQLARLAGKAPPVFAQELAD